MTQITKATQFDGNVLPSENLWTRLQAALIAFIVTARCLYPTEAAADGETLWIVALSLFAGCLSVWKFPFQSTGPKGFSSVYFFVGLLIAGHVLSALFLVVNQSGDRRAAVNMMWEWIGLGVLFFLVRQCLVFNSSRRQLIHILLTTGVVLAGLGIWQHHVYYPSTSQAYWKTRTLLDDYLSRPAPVDQSQAATHRQTIQQLQREIIDLGVPLEGTERLLFESRLSASSEPFGMFALANTFAGFLLVAVLLSLGLMTSVWPKLSLRSQWIGAAICIVIVGYCLILTKSRTAVVGVCIGVLAGTLVWWRQGKPFGRTQIIWTTAIAVLVSVVVGVATWNGSLDKEMILESSKSLKYRFQYWSGATSVIADAPVLGVGPGNFRQHYLKYKLPESSEEVADPHNWFLDVWCSGGLISVVGILGLLSYLFFRNGPVLPSPSDSESKKVIEVPAKKKGQKSSKATRSSVTKLGGSFVAPEMWRSPWTWGAYLCLVAMAVNGVMSLGFGDYRDSALYVFVICWPFVCIVLFSVVRLAEVVNWQIKVVLLALTVHLLAAGGIEMPAIMQLLLIFVALLAPTGSSEASADVGRKIQVPFNTFGKIAMPVLLVGCVFTAVIPTSNRQSLIAAGDYASSLSESIKYYDKAVEADSLSPVPEARLAGAHFLVWQQSDKSSTLADEEFQKAVSHMRRAIKNNPHGFAAYQQLGEWHVEKFNASKLAVDIENACQEFTEAVGRYPNLVSLRAKRALAFQQASRNPEAASEAETALQLDEINRQELHSDKYLDEKLREKLSKIVRSRTDEKPGDGQN